MIKLILLMTLQSFFLVLAQVFLKCVIDTTKKFKFSLDWLVSIFLNYWIWLLFLSMIVSGIIWIYVLKHYPFNRAYPLISISYILGLLVSVIVFKEYVPIERWIGVTIIIIGIFFITYK